MRPLAFACLLLVGCIEVYKPPTPDQPHGLVKLRRSYAAIAGKTLRESVLLNDDSALSTDLAVSVAAAPRTDSILVHPVPTRFQFSSLFFHIEMHSVQETYTVNEYRVESEYYDCSSGSGTSRMYRTCSRSVNRSTPVTKHRTVTKAVEVDDGRCSSAFTFTPVDEHVYLVQYTYRDSGVCELACYEQLARPKGELQNRPCAE